MYCFTIYLYWTHNVFDCLDLSRFTNYLDHLSLSSISVTRDLIWDTIALSLYICCISFSNVSTSSGLQLLDLVNFCRRESSTCKLSTCFLCVRFDRLLHFVLFQLSVNLIQLHIQQRNFLFYIYRINIPNGHLMSTISDYYNATAVLVGSFVGYQRSGSKA